MSYKESQPIHKSGIQIYFFDKLQDARRVTACVNACQGIKTENLERAAKQDTVGNRLLVMRGEL